MCLYAAAQNVAKSDRTLYPYKLDSKESFDFASKLEILTFLEVLLNAKDNIDDYISVKTPNADSIKRYIDSTIEVMRGNYDKSTHSYSYPHNFLPNLKLEDNYTALFEMMNHRLPKELQPWRENALAFYKAYVSEQLRLAALFPRITSEILTFNTNEIRGDELEDKHFILSFDDGPTKKYGNSDKLLNLLRDLDTPAIFFVLGESMQRRGWIDADFYKGFVLGYHGEEHKPHTKREIWLPVLSNTQELARLNGNDCVFRPPYGQRSEEFSRALQEGDCKLMLWNIDSQDWSSKINANEMLHRIISLSLLWRSGIVLFHDTHSKSYQILPAYIKMMRDMGVKFIK